MQRSVRGPACFIERCVLSGCGKRFATLDDLKAHFRRHKSGREYVCTTPGCARVCCSSDASLHAHAFQFPDRSQCVAHMRTHTSIRPLACPFDARRFTQPCLLHPILAGLALSLAAIVYLITHLVRVHGQTVEAAQSHLGGAVWGELRICANEDEDEAYDMV